MSNDNNSEVKQAANEVSPNELKDNLDTESSNINNNEKPKAENLDNDEKTSFIDDDLRTDK